MKHFQKTIQLQFQISFPTFILSSTMCATAAVLRLFIIAVKNIILLLIAALRGAKESPRMKWRRCGCKNEMLTNVLIELMNFCSVLQQDREAGRCSRIQMSDEVMSLSQCCNSAALSCNTFDPCFTFHFTKRSLFETLF